MAKTWQQYEKDSRGKYLGSWSERADTSFLLSPAASLIKSGQISSSAGEDAVKTRVSNEGSRRFHSHKKAYLILGPSPGWKQLLAY